MRNVMMAVLLAATTAMPVAASAQEVQMTERYRQLGERNQARADRRAERQQERASVGQAVRQERLEQRADRREMRQDRREDRREWRQERREDVRERRQDRREDFREHIRDSRDASRDSARGLPPRYQRQAEINQRRYEDRLRDDRREWREDRREWRDDRRDWRQDRRADRREWRRDWRNDRRYDWQRYRFSNHHIFRPGRYYAPFPRHSYSRFGIGVTLGRPFYSDRYWLNDPWQYRLPPAYAGTRWVRYYDDVLLVDLYTGEVLDVIYNFFW